MGAQVLTDLSGFAPPTIMDQAARLMSRQRFFNLVVTNVPGPQFPLYLAGRRMLDPLPDGAAGRRARASAWRCSPTTASINFGLVGDYDMLWDLDELADDVRASLAELADAAGVQAHLAPTRAGLGDTWTA